MFCLLLLFTIAAAHPALVALRAANCTAAPATASCAWRIQQARRSIAARLDAAWHYAARAADRRALVALNALRVPDYYTKLHHQ